MEFVNRSELNCPFCSITVKERTIKEGLYSTLIIPRHGINNSQLLLISKRHVVSIDQLTSYELADVFKLLKIGLLILKQNGIYNYNIAINNGEIAGQTVNHFHLHIIPRTKEDIKEPKKWLNTELFEKLIENNDSDIMKIREDLIDNLEINDKYIIGKNATIDINVIIANDNRTELVTYIGDNAKILSGTVIYSGVNIGNDFDCGHNVIIRERCKIGKNVYIYPNTVINTDVVIGDNCTISGYLCNRSKIGNNVNMFGKLIHKFDKHQRGIIEESPVILDNCTIGWDSLIVGGIVIKENSFIKAKTIIK